MEGITRPTDIEKRSFAIIRAELARRPLRVEVKDPRLLNVIVRVIHTTADFDYADNLVFSAAVIDVAEAALKSGAEIVTDTKMALAGMNKKALDQLGCSAHCFIDAPEVVAEARQQQCTRARAAIDYAVQTLKAPLIFAIGNAPTALIRLSELIQNNDLKPALIIGVPVGFVNVVESKELICALPVAQIVARGQKGGSNVAAAIMNALTYEITTRDF